jgi:bifunctional non-homologous end joining protein LigD
VDGELVAVDADGRPSFQALQNQTSARLSLVYYAFDLLHRNGRDLRALTLVERKRQLAEVAAGSGVQLSVALDGSVDDISRAVKDLGLEGIVAKRRTSRYSSGRHHHWVKVKFLNRQEFVIGGYKPGLGTFESLIVGYYDRGALRFAGKVRNGLTPLLRRQLWPKLRPFASTTYPFVDVPSRTKSHWGEGLTLEDMHTLRWLEPRLVAEVGFVEWTNEAHLRHPTFLGLREDKDPNDVVREAAGARR